MVYISFLLPLVKSNGKYRWATASVGNAHELTSERIQLACAKVYGTWAWGTAMKEQHTPAEIFSMHIPEDLEPYLALIAQPPLPAVSEIWERIGFDPVTGRDSYIRQKESCS